jgi:hypothetical protein
VQQCVGHGSTFSFCRFNRRRSARASAALAPAG